MVARTNIHAVSKMATIPRTHDPRPDAQRPITQRRDPYRFIENQQYVKVWGSPLLVLHSPDSTKPVGLLMRQRTTKSI
jgi:hypothetical protein